MGNATIQLGLIADVESLAFRLKITKLDDDIAVIEEMEPIIITNCQDLP